MRKLAKAIGVLLVYLVVFDIIGVAGCFALDLFSAFDDDGLIYAYTMWFVAGVFCGLLGYIQAGEIFAPSEAGARDWADRKDSAGISGAVLLAAFVAIVLVAIPCYYFQWADPSSPYVPDNESLSITYLATVLASMVFAHFALRRASRKEAATQVESAGRQTSSN